MSTVYKVVINVSNLTPKSIGTAYSSLIDSYLELGQVKEAEDVVVNEVMAITKTRVDPKSGLEVKLLNVEHLNRSTINKLIKAIREKEQREPNFPINGQKSSSSSDSDLSDSSDEEVIDVKNK